MSGKDRIPNIMDNMIEQSGQCEALKIIFCVFFVLFSSNCWKFAYQYQCNRLPGETRESSPKWPIIMFSGTLHARSLTHLTPKGPNQLQSHHRVGSHSVTGVPVAPAAKTTDWRHWRHLQFTHECLSRMSAPHLSIDAGQRSPPKNWHRALLNTIDQHKTNRPIVPSANETRNDGAISFWVF